MTVAKKSASGIRRKSLAAGVKKNIVQSISKLETNEPTILRRFSPRLQKESASGIRCKALAAGAKKNIVQRISKSETNESTILRRFSPRIQKIPDEKRPYYGSVRKRKVEVNNEKVSDKKTKVKHSKQGFSLSGCRGTRNDNEEDEVNENGKAEVINLAAGSERTVGAIDDELNWVNSGASPIDDKGKSFTARVKEEVNNAESTILRRFSPRTQNIPDEKRPYYGSDRKRKVEVNNEKVSDKKAKVKHSKQGFSLSGCGGTRNDNEEDEVNENGKADVTNLAAGSERTVGAIDDVSKWMNSGASPIDDKGKSFTARVKETLRKFNAYYLQFAKEELKRCRTEDKSAHNGDARRSSMRPDLKAANEMRRKKEILYPEKGFGNLPGVNVGHQFFSRCEMVAIGFHSHWLNGIDFIGKPRKKEYKSYTFPLAVAIVLSGQYEDDVDNSEEIVYTGQGGNDLLGNKRQINDQKMTGGNLALKNNMEQSIPVRVVRGHKCVTSYSKKLYTYDGLYKVDKYWAEKGAAGYTVYKYRLKRLPGQPILLTNQVYFSRGQGTKLLSELPGLVCKDICDGQENICVPATNIIDDPPIAPSGFTYTKSIQVDSGIRIPLSAPGCNCKGKCTNPRTCSCAKLNGSDFPYVSKNGGRLIEAMDVVFECGPNCGCGPECVNRTSQQGLKYKLEVYRTQNKGWAVRSMDYIPSGAPVCEYTGLLKKTDALESVSGNDYIFEIDCWQTINGIGGRERRLRDVSLPSDHADKRDGTISETAPDFCIDAGSSGNVARFINHSCEPNLFVQCVLSSHHDVKLARIVLFAADNIPALQELTYDYGYALNSVVGPNGKIKKLACHCGAAGCRKRLY